VDKKNWLIMGLEPRQFEATTMNPRRRFNMEQAVTNADKNHVEKK
jgi:hypothetical protein